jgi:hypothetical protein
MTSREATGLLPRSHAEDWEEYERTLREWATLLAFGPLNAPFLLKSLYGGSKKAK